MKVGEEPNAPGGGHRDKGKMGWLKIWDWMIQERIHQNGLKSPLLCDTSDLFLICYIKYGKENVIVNMLNEFTKKGGVKTAIFSKQSLLLAVNIWPLKLPAQKYWVGQGTTSLGAMVASPSIELLNSLTGHLLWSPDLPCVLMEVRPVLNPRPL